MGLVYSRNLCQGVLLDTTGVTCFTVPAAETWIIKQLDVVNVTATARYYNLYRNAVTASGAFRNRHLVLANHYVSEGDRYWAFAAGETFHGLAEANSALRVTAWGYKLSD